MAKLKAGSEEWQKQTDQILESHHEKNDLPNDEAEKGGSFVAYLG